MQLENIQWTAVSEGTQTLIYCILILVYLPNANLIDLQPETLFLSYTKLCVPSWYSCWVTTDSPSFI